MTTRYSLTLTKYDRWSGHYETRELARAAVPAGESYRIERETCREGVSICATTRGEPCIDVCERVTVETGPLPERPGEGVARIDALGRVFDVPAALARLAGWCVYDDGHTRIDATYAERHLAVALSEGRTGADALLRVIAIAEGERAGQYAPEVRAAQLHRDAAEIALRTQREAELARKREDAD